mmetsp:Transcript_54650/g.169207  ORF Transcript_54650/g.169207 Transcript_54650/m.169207 type:complete len:221 (+) Transcript_54650:205-867(+)
MPAPQSPLAARALHYVPNPTLAGRCGGAMCAGPGRLQRAGRAATIPWPSSARPTGACLRNRRCHCAQVQPRAAGHATAAWASVKRQRRCAHGGRLLIEFHRLGPLRCLASAGGRPASFLLSRTATHSRPGNSSPRSSSCAGHRTVAGSCEAASEQRWLLRGGPPPAARRGAGTLRRESGRLRHRPWSAASSARRQRCVPLGGLQRNDGHDLVGRKRVRFT